MDRDQAVSLEHIEISLKDEVRQARIFEDSSKDEKIQSLEQQLNNKSEVSEILIILWKIVNLSPRAFSSL